LPWFPLVGALLGAGVATLNWALEPIISRGLRDVIAIAALLLITGMLHFDGFVDCCDALLGTRSVERRLEILRDKYGKLRDDATIEPYSIEANGTSRSCGERSPFATRKPSEAAFRIAACTTRLLPIPASPANSSRVP